MEMAAAIQSAGGGQLIVVDFMTNEELKSFCRVDLDG